MKRNTEQRMFGTSILLTAVFLSQLCFVTMQRECRDSQESYPDPKGACDIFFECVTNEDNIAEPIIRHCEDGNHFSKHLQTCVHPDKALCLPELKKLSCLSSGERLAHPTNCSRYFECNSTLWPTVTECSYDLHFSDALKDCVPKREAHCDLMYCDELEDPMRPTLLPDPKNCAAFFKCHNGRAMPMLCPTNLYFSIERDRCEFPFSVNCTNGIRPKSQTNH